MHFNLESIRSNQEQIPTKSERDTMSNAALDCQEWVQAPSSGKGSSGQQIYAAWKAFNDALPRNHEPIKYWRVKAAFHGKAGSWGVAAYLQLRDAHDRWKAKREQTLSANARAAIEVLAAQREYLSAVDAEGHQEQIDGIDYAIGNLRSSYTRLTPPKEGE
ncbi:MAG: hypothetical protein ACE37E_01100 [Hyphomicrobiales bacterium]